MGLNERITAKLNAGIDADVFERCAVALMANHYENVVGIEGGSDGGRDGDIIAPIADVPDSRGRILVTTGDSLDNLKSSHKTWKKFWEAGETFRVDQIVMVTSNKLSDTKRRNIETYCTTNNLPVPHIYARQWLVESLRRDTDLRVELTGIEGRLEALSTKAPEPLSTAGLVGRDEELERLRAAVARASDVCVVGVPGVGKTRLLAELEGELHFVDCLAREYLIEDLFALEPTTVVLDDAHLHLDVLGQMVSIRSQEQLKFTIVTATWPGSETAVEALLKDPTRVEVDRLGRAALDQMIQALGVHGVRVRSLVLEQSDGRPGWAAILCRLLVDGKGEDLANGQSLLDQVASLAAAVAGNAVLDEALACVAALNSASLEDIEVIASYVGVPHANLIAWLEAIAQGGLVDRTDDSWSVLIPLRSLIVASTFFGARKRRNWASFAAKFPNDERLVRTILDVANRGAGSEPRALADAWFAGVSAREIDTVPLALVELYGSIDETRADRAAQLARTVLDSPRVPQVLYGNTTYEPVGAAAEGVLRTAFRHTCSREALQGLLDLALTDDRPRHQYPDHPMRVIRDMAHYLDPDLGPFDGLRERILTNALEWHDEKPNEAHWGVLAEVARYVFDPSVEGNWADPSSHLSLTISHGVMTAGAMESLLCLWSEIDSRVRGEAAANITRSAAASLCEIFELWSALAASITPAGVDATEEQKVVGARGTELILNTLLALTERFPAVPLRVNKQLALTSTWNGQSSLEELRVSDDRLARFVGIREPDDDIESWMVERRDQQTSLALELDNLPPVKGVAEYVRLLLEASVLGGNHEGDAFAAILAANVTDAGSWLNAAIEGAARPLVAPLVARARSEGADIANQVRMALATPELRSGVLRAILHEEADLDDLAHTVLDCLTDDDVPLIGDLWIRDSVTPMLRAMLAHPRPAVRALAAVAFGEGPGGHGPALPDELKGAWRQALVGAVPERLPQHSRWRLGKLLKHAVATDPELCADWFILNAGAPALSSRTRRLAISFADLLHALPKEQRRRIITSLGVEQLVSSGFAGDVLDTDLATELLSEGVVDGPALLSALSGYRDRTIEALAPALLAAKIAPDLIVTRALRNRNWTGAESGAILKDLEFFAELRDRRPELAEVCAVAAHRLSNELEAARAQEDDDSRRGW